MIVDNIRYNRKKLHNLGSKVIHLQLHWKFLEICSALNVTVEGLQINKTSCRWNNYFKENRKRFNQPSIARDFHYIQEIKA